MISAILRDDSYSATACVDSPSTVLRLTWRWPSSDESCRSTCSIVTYVLDRNHTRSLSCARRSSSFSNMWSCSAWVTWRLKSHPSRTWTWCLDLQYRGQDHTCRQTPHLRIQESTFDAYQHPTVLIIQSFTVKDTYIVDERIESDNLEDTSLTKSCEMESLTVRTHIDQCCVSDALLLAVHEMCFILSSLSFHDTTCP